MSGPAPLDGFSTVVRRETERVLDACPGTHGELLRCQHGLEREKVAGGKAASSLVAPALCLLTADALGGRREQALAAASAVAFLQSYVFIETDIATQCAERNGQPTLWRRWGAPLALNAADGMVSQAHQSLARLAEGSGSARALAAARLLDDACLRLCEEEFAYYASAGGPGPSEADHIRVAQARERALLALAASLGALVGGVEEKALGAFSDFGNQLGVARGLGRDGARTAIRALDVAALPEDARLRLVEAAGYIGERGVK